MPIKDRKHVPLTADPRSSKTERVIRALKIKANWKKSNRDLGRELEVDESMVRRYRAKLNVPSLAPHTGEPTK